MRRQVLAADPGCVKGLYRRAQAHLGQQDFVEAEMDIRAALQVSSAAPTYRPVFKYLSVFCTQCWLPQQQGCARSHAC